LLSSKDLVQWFAIDGQWGRDYAYALSRVGEYTPPLVVDALNTFAEIMVLPTRGLGEQSTLNATVGKLLLFEDMVYMKKLSELTGISLNGADDALSEMIGAVWPEESTPIPTHLLPYVVPYHEGRDVDSAALNADILWTYSFLSRGSTIMVSMPEAQRYLSEFLVMGAGAPLALERLRLALIRRDEVDIQHLRALRWADGMWWRNICRLTGWEPCDDMFKLLVSNKA